MDVAQPQESRGRRIVRYATTAGGLAYAVYQSPVGDLIYDGIRDYARGVIRRGVDGSAGTLQRRTERDTRRAGNARSLVRARDESQSLVQQPQSKKAKIDQASNDHDTALDSGTTMPRRGSGIRMTRFHALNCVEFKKIDYEEDGTPGTATTAEIHNPLANMIVGSASNDRVGRRIFISSLQANFRIHLPGLTAAAATTANVLKEQTYLCAIVLDTLHNGVDADPTYADLFDSDVWLGMPMRNLNDIKRYRILKMKIVYIPSRAVRKTGADTYDLLPVDKHFACLLKFKRALQVDFKTASTGAARTDIETNYVTACIFPGSENARTYSYNLLTRVRYTD